MNIQSIGLRAVLLASVPMLGMGVAQAQSGPATGANQATAQIQEVVVTARKRSESASKTPIALTAISGTQLQSEGITNAVNLQNVVPGVAVNRGGFGLTTTIRGVTTTDGTSKGEPGINFNVDGAPVSRGQEQAEAFFDLERVEVLRGPQGTLYGKSSTGGAINLITNKPVFKNEGSASVEIGNYDTKRATIVANVPLTSIIAVRAAGNYNYQAPYITASEGSSNGASTKLNEQDDLAARISALAQFSDDMKLLLSATGGTISGAGYGSVPVTVNPTSLVINSPQLGGYYNPFPNQLADHYLNNTYIFDDTFGPVHLTYEGAYDNYTAREHSAGTGDPAANSDDYSWRDYRGSFVTYSQELRISNQNPGLLTYVAGLNWNKEQISESDHNWDAPVSDPTYAASFNGIDPLNHTDHTAYSVFGQGVYSITQALHLTLGARLSDDQMQRIGTFAAGPGPWLNPYGGACVAPDDCVGGSNNEGEKDRKFTWRVGLDDQFAANQMVYGSVATGFKAGGANDFTLPSEKPGVYGPETLTAYELGYKGRPVPGLQFNSSAFYYDYAADQLSGLVNIDGNLVIYTRLAPTTIYGWENEAHYLFLDDNLLDLSVALEKSKYNSFMAGLDQNVNWSGLSLDNTPAAVVTAGLSHYFDLANGGSIKLHADTKYSTSSIYSDSTGYIYFSPAIGGLTSTPFRYTQPAYTRSDADVTYTWPSGNSTLTLFVHNIENKLQAQGAAGNYNPSFTGGPGGTNDSGAVGVTEPRFWGARYTVKY